MWQELYESLEIAKTNETSVIVVTATGRAFSAGDDIPSMYQFKNQKESLDFFKILLKPLESLLSIEKPLIGMVNGLAYGGGFEMLLLMDIVIATKDSKFALPEINLGLIPPIALSIGYSVLGLKQANRLALIGEPIDSYEAQRIGLVDYVVDKDKLKDKTLEVIWKILSNAIQPTQFIKKWANRHKNKAELSETMEKLSELSLKEESKQRMEAFIKK